MAYKDEYEVARLLLLEEPRAAVHEIAGERMKVSFLLHPPVLRSLGVKRKIRFGEWTLPVFRVLAAMKRLRETPFDIFGFTAMRRTERRLRDEYLAVIADLCRSARPEDAARAVRIAALPDMVRGYEEIKMARVRQFDAELQGLMQGGSPPD
jgi:indolepyruvate ferredoxin oxidoreductase